MQLALAEDDRRAEPAVKPSERRSVARAIGISGLFFLICMIGLLAVVGWWSYANAIREAENSVRSASRLAANQVGRMMESADLLLTDMWRIARVADWNDPDVRTLAENEMRLLARQLPHVARLMIYGPDGNLRVASDRADVLPENASGHEFFSAHGARRDRLHVGPFGAPVGGADDLVLSRRVGGGTEAFDGVVVVAIRPAAFGAFFRTLSAGPDPLFALIHEDLSLLVREPQVSPSRAQADPIDPELRQRIGDGAAGSFTFASADGTVRLADVRRVEGYPLFVAVGVSRAAVIERWVRGVAPYFLFAAAAFVGLALLTLTAVRRALREDHLRTELIRANADLEARVLERTRSLAEALEAKDTLFKELNHRVKNNLQIVSSLLGLQAGKFSDPAVVEGFQSCLGRIRTMSAVHEQLYRKDQLAHVDFGDYLRLLCTRLAESYGAGDRIELDVEAESDFLDVRTTVPLALFVNEAVSNVFKHAFPDGRAGTITVRYAHEGERRRLVIRDDGVGTPAEAGSGRSLGLKLSQALAQQIGGSLRQEPADPGTRIELLFTPASDGEENGGAPAGH